METIDAPHTQICITCGQKRPISNFAGRGFHVKNGVKLRYRLNQCRKCQKAEKEAAGICKMCCSPVVPGNKRCQKHLNLDKDSKKRLKKADRKAAFAHYGESCAYCGQSVEMFLTIDHINDDGAEHRRTQRSGGYGGHDIYAWLRKNGYPEGFQILCFNCNSAKGHYGEEVVKEAVQRNLAKG